MRILNAIHAQYVGGVNAMFRNYTESLIDGGHEVALLISDYKKENYEDLLGVKKIFKLANLNPVFDVIKLLFILIKFKPDFIFCHSNRIIKRMRILKYFTKAKSVAINHGITFKSSLSCDYIININEEINEMVLRSNVDSSRCFVINNAIKIQEKFFTKSINNPLVIGIYGRIEERKGFDILIKAAEILKKNDLNFLLKIGGFSVLPNYNQQSLEDLARSCDIIDECKFVGIVTDKKEFFSDIDILCVPSREEPFGLVILEGFLHSTLVISSNSDGAKILIKNGENGIIFENENHQELAEKILEISSQKIDYSKLTKNAFALLENEFGLKSLTKKLNQFLESIQRSS